MVRRLDLVGDRGAAMFDRGLRRVARSQLEGRESPAPLQRSGSCVGSANMNLAPPPGR